jgi:ATP-dependent DNA helicase RecQ
MSGHKKFIASFNRENLFLQIIPKRKPFEQTVAFLNEHKNQSGIIYCFSRKQVESLHEDLSDLGFSTKPYHAGLSDEERNKNQDLFIKDEVQIIIATIAFGMGINKSNVRFVLHYDLPKNIESYYQEIGRSGRDGVRADCLLLFGYGDISKINYFIDQKEDPVERRSAEMHLQAMVQYAETEVCRRQPLIKYFGEDYSEDYCGMCDNCTLDEKESVDVTINAQKFLSAVKRTGEVFGVNYIIDVLCGAESDRIFSNGHQNLSVYGVGKELNKKQWQILAHQFIRKELIRRDIEFGSLKLNESANDVLFKNKKVSGFIKQPEVSQKRLKLTDEGYDKNLFELLRAERKYIADSHNIPPFVIFSDASLIQMAKDFPVNEGEFLRISGVGVNKLERYGKVFIPIIKKYADKNGISNKREDRRVSRKRSLSDKPRHIIVGESYNDGKSIKELEEQFNVKTQTIISHLVRYTNEGRSVRTDGLAEMLTVDKKYHKKVFEHFNMEGTQQLSPAFEKFNQEISYLDLHILKLIYLNNNMKK